MRDCLSENENFECLTCVSNCRRSASLSGLPVRLQRSSGETDVTSPSHMRKVGKLLHLNSDGSQVVELVKPPSGPFGFYIARGTSNFGSGKYTQSSISFVNWEQIFFKEYVGIL